MSSPEDATSAEPAVQADAAPPAIEAGSTTPPGDAAVRDADQLRGFHFRRLLGGRWTRLAIAAAALLPGVAVGLAAGPLAGSVVALLALALALGVVFAVADSRAADSFFEVYAAQRGLALGGRCSLPAATPLLRKGSRRYAERTLSGELGAGLQGTLALFTYEEETRDANGNRQTKHHRYTLGLVEVPACAAQLPELYCQQRFGLRAFEKLEDVFRRAKERVRLESAALDERYEIFSGRGQDAVWLRRVFSPSFIVWLTEEAPRKFAFELVDGTLCCYVHDHREGGAELDMVSAATAAVAARLRGEAEE